jgi:sugar phosphate permease
MLQFLCKKRNSLRLIDKKGMFMETTVKKQQTQIMAWGLCFITAVFYAFQYILRLLPNILKDDLMSNYMIDAAAFGNFNGIYYLGYALLHLPVGLALDRFGPKYTISLSVLLCGLGIIPPLYTDSWLAAVCGRFLLGAGSTTAILGVFYVIRLNFPPIRFASVLGMSVTLGFAGALFGSRPIGILNEMVGWQNVLTILFGASIVLAAFFLIFMPNQKEELQPNSKSILLDLRELFSNKHVWAVALLSGLMVGPLEGFADAWGVPFLKTVYGIDQATAQILPSMIFFGFCFGAPLLGYLGEKYKKPYSVMIYSALCMGLIYTALLLFKLNNVPFLCAIMILIGILCAYQVFMIFINTRVVKPHLVGISSSFTNMVMMSFGLIFHPLIGWIISKNWDGQIINDIPIYSSDAYIYGLMVLPVGLFIAFVGFMVIKPKDESLLLEENTKG